MTRPAPCDFDIPVHGDGWQPIETAPRDRHILVYYDHDADLYTEAERNDRLTSYAAHAEGGDFLDGTGITIAKWCDGWHESEDEYGNGYWMPAWWFAYFRGDYVWVCNPTHWMPLPAPPEAR